MELHFTCLNGTENSLISNYIGIANSKCGPKFVPTVDWIPFKLAVDGTPYKHHKMKKIELQNEENGTNNSTSLVLKWNQ